MESIEINGFLTIDSAFFEIKKVNILIGAQAQGKSLIAKLIYFFKRCFGENFITSIEEFETKREFDRRCLIQFEEFFPRYAWDHQEFSIIYRNDNYIISLKNTQLAKKMALKLDYCSDLAYLHKKLKTTYKNALEKFDSRIDQENKKGLQKREMVFYQIVIKELDNTEFSHILNKSIFIPAGRSFFFLLQRNIFSFLTNNTNIDPFIKEFGSLYENSKRLQQASFFRYDETTQVIIKKIDKLVGGIIGGEYILSDGQDWILNDGKRINLANASSGQQESVPMLIILKILPFIYNFYQTKMFFIEEPEAHLFPASQKTIISLIALINNKLDHSFFITTHSPYILTAINNLIIGQDAFNKAKADNKIDYLKQLEQVIPSDELMRLEDVSAYTLENGKLESIIDSENRLIGANLLDAVSNEFDSAFDVAADILYGNK